ncbi:MAG: hypothetical protein WC197_00980 [Candidatus Gastranaerophilaceae bacterium]|jgi:hypothetical protein
MYQLSQIKEKLLEKNYFIDEITVKEFLKNWKIEAIYEDEEGHEFYDDMALENILKGMELKSQGESDKEILDILTWQKIQKENLPQKVEIQTIEEAKEVEPQKISLDITNNTLSFLAETMAQKITQDVTAHLKESNLILDIQQIENLKKDNEIMAFQIKNLNEENKKLITKISDQAIENNKYKHIFGAVYIKEEK